MKVNVSVDWNNLNQKIHWKLYSVRIVWHLGPKRSSREVNTGFLVGCHTLKASFGFFFLALHAAEKISFCNDFVNENAANVPPVTVVSAVLKILSLSIKS